VKSLHSLRDAGLLGLTIPKEYGGKGGDALDYAIVVEELIRTSRLLDTRRGPVRNDRARTSMILLAQEERTRKKYLPPIVSGEIGCAIALTEPNHGSDLTDLETTAVPDGNDFIINATNVSSRARRITSFTRYLPDLTASNAARAAFQVITGTTRLPRGGLVGAVKSGKYRVKLVMRRARDETFVAVDDEVITIGTAVVSRSVRSEP